MPGIPSGVKKGARGIKAGYKGAKQGYKTGKKGAKMTKKGVKGGVMAVVDAKGVRNWEKKRRQESTAGWAWKERDVMKIEENCDIPSIRRFFF